MTPSVPTRRSSDLFERRKEGMIPTEAGAILCAQSEKAMAILSGGIRRARGAGSGVADAYQLVTMAQLRALIALADAGSYISASAATGLSQPDRKSTRLNSSH